MPIGISSVIAQAFSQEDFALPRAILFVIIVAGKDTLTILVVRSLTQGSHVVAVVGKNNYHQRGQSYSNWNPNQRN